jgi:hypothetical protein
LRRLLVHHCLRHDLNPGRVPPFILAKAKSAVSAAITALPHPPNVNQNVPMASATYAL